MNHIMLDIETMGHQPDAAIVAIGAVKFCPETNTINDKFYERIFLKSAADFGLTTDPDTIIWWLKQSERARRQVTNDLASTLPTALEHFADFCGHNPIIWGNGSDFDNVILATAYKKTGMSQPWKFRNNRCYRTIKNLYKHIIIAREGTAHIAIDDAIYQATHLMKIASRTHMELK